MARRKNAVYQRGVMEILIDPLFGLFGAMIVVFIIQIIATVNTVDRDLQDSLSDMAYKYNRVKDIERKFNVLNGYVEILQTEIERARDKNGVLEREVMKAKRMAAEHQARADHLEANINDSGKDLSAGEIARLSEKIKKFEEKADAEIIPLRIKTMKLPPAITGEPYILTMASEGGTPPYLWTLMGSLPDGLEFNKKNGLIRGSAEKTGTTSFTIGLRDVTGARDDRALTVNVRRAGGVEGEQSWKEKINTWLIILVCGFVVLIIILIVLSYIDSKKKKNEGFELAWVQKENINRI